MTVSEDFFAAAGLDLLTAAETKASYAGTPSTAIARRICLEALRQSARSSCIEGGYTDLFELLIAEEKAMRTLPEPDCHDEVAVIFGKIDAIVDEITRAHVDLAENHAAYWADLEADRRGDEIRAGV